MWEKKKLLVTSIFPFLQCFPLNQKTVSPFVNIFDIISLFDELEEPKMSMCGKGLINAFGIWILPMVVELDNEYIHTKRQESFRMFSLAKTCSLSKTLYSN